jgi:ABC-type antimicrobial peptide transport system permease subunit
MALLLVVICVIVAILVYARTATRQCEIAVRSALGASRGRIVTQLFGEASLLSALGAAVGLVIVWGVASRLDVMLAQVGVGILAAMVPARQALGIQPTVVLKEA